YTTEQQYRGGPFTPASGTFGQPALLGRPLLFAEEIMRFPKDQVLLLQARHAPARLSLPDLSKWAPLFVEVSRPVSGGQPGWTTEVDTWSLTPRPGETPDEDIDPSVFEEGY
nr:hypothetical protein [Thermaerobacter sp.]